MAPDDGVLDEELEEEENDEPEMKDHIFMADLLEGIAEAYGSLNQKQRSGAGTEEDPYVYEDYPSVWSISCTTAYLIAKSIYDESEPILEGIDTHSPLYSECSLALKNLDASLDAWLIKWRDYFNPTDPE